jgi:hypothetical protein
VDQYTQELFKEGVSAADATKSVVKKLNAEIERRLLALTVNAPDWCVIQHYSRRKHSDEYAGRHSMLLKWR